MTVSFLPEKIIIFGYVMREFGATAYAGQGYTN